MSKAFLAGLALLAFLGGVGLTVFTDMLQDWQTTNTWGRFPFGG